MSSMQQIFAIAAVVSQMEHNLNWPAYIAQTCLAAEELSGIKTEVTWEQPPK